MSDLIKQIEELNLRCDSSTLLPVILQVEQLLKERDEARRMYCFMVENNARQYGASAQSVAKQAGWDCYKEETTPQPPWFPC